MKIKILVATEAESSITIRLTPGRIGSLIGKLSKSQLRLVLSVAAEYLGMFGDKGRQQVVKSAIDQQEPIKTHVNRHLIRVSDPGAKPCEVDICLDYCDIRGRSRFCYIVNSHFAESCGKSNSHYKLVKKVKP